MIRLLVLSFWLMGSVAAAQTVPVRSGEHATFSRLVLTLPPATDWRLGRDDQGYVLELDRPLDFALDGVFDRLPEARIASLTQAVPGRLLLRRACDCHVAAFLWQDDRLVIDVTMGPAPAGSPFEQWLDPPAPPAAVPAVLPVVTTRVRPLPTVMMPDPFAASDDQDDRLAQAGQALRESVAMAATQGLLIPSPREISVVPLPATVAVDAAAEGTGLPDSLAVIGPQTSPLAAAQPGIAFLTAPDRARLDQADRAEGHCFSDNQFDVANWVGGPDFAAEVGRRRAAILSAENDLLGAAVEELARAYLHFGFGLEAEQALDMDNLGSSDRRVLRALARLADGHEPDPDVLAGQANCTGAVALWAALANGSVAGAGTPARISIEAAHRALPPQLRLHLAAPLAAAFLAAGDSGTADAILSATAAVADTPPLAVEMTGAEIQLVTEGPEVAIATLGGLAAHDDRLTAEGLVRLMDLTIGEGRAPDTDVLALSEAMRFEARGTPAAEALLAAEIRSNILAADFDRAIGLLDSDMGERVYAGLRAEVAIAMATSATPARFVDAVFGPLADDLTPEAENIVAARLLSLGFAERALALLTPATEGAAMAERRYLRAEAALALGRVLQAEAALTGLDDPRADRLRAAARTTVGDHAGALAAAGPQTDAGLAWRAGDWSAADLGVDPVMAGAAAARQELPPALGSAPPLAARSALLSEAAATRALAQDLLSRFADTSPAEVPGLTANE